MKQITVYNIRMHRTKPRNAMAISHGHAHNANPPTYHVLRELSPPCLPVSHIHFPNSYVGSEFQGTQKPHCWKGQQNEKVTELLASHIIHPNKLMRSTAGVEFAETLNQPAVGIAFAAHRESCATDSTHCSDYDEDLVMPFWCQV